MNLYSLMAIFRTAVHNDSDLQAWCATTYGQAHHVYAGIDLRNPPKESEYPLVFFALDGKTQGQGVANMAHRIGVDCGIANESLRTIAGESNTVELAGISEIAEFNGYVLDIFQANLPAGYFIDTVETTYSEIDTFPFFLSQNTVQIGRRETQGVDWVD